MTKKVKCDYCLEEVDELVIYGKELMCKECQEHEIERDQLRDYELEESYKYMDDEIDNGGHE